MSRLPPSPNLCWSHDGSSLSSAAFGDIYFSKEDGFAESQAVFLAGTGLPDAWRNRARYALCELGFGTGLNLLATWRAWRLSRQPHALLHISSIEAYPMARADAARALAHFPELSEFATKLLTAWPVRAAAAQRLWFPEDGLSITLHTGDGEAVLASLEGAFDAWFLDGFAPAANPQMWSASVLRHVARLSAPGARLASFTVAGEVRRTLESLGFKVERKPGFGRKRERLEATWTGGRAEATSLYPYCACAPKRVAVLGAGIAGAACAQALVRRGVETVVVDAAPALGAGASGNPAGLVMPRLDRGGPLASFYLAAYLHAVAAYEALGAWAPCGVEQLPLAGAEEALADLLRDPPLPEDWLRPLPGGGAYHPRAGLTDPIQAAERMLEGATLLFETPIGALDRAEGGLIVRATDGRALLKADAVVLACGAGLKQFAPAAFLPIMLSRGQVEWGEAHALAHARTRGSYCAPYRGGVLFGATFDTVDEIDAADNEELRCDARRRNLAALSALAPEAAATLNPERLSSRVSHRATTPDRAPVAGMLPDAEPWLKRYAALAHGGRVDLGGPTPAHNGVYVIGGLGSRGLTHAPILGEVIAGEMCGEPELLSRTARNALHPARFLHRALKRR